MCMNRAIATLYQPLAIIESGLFGRTGLLFGTISISQSLGLVTTFE